MSAPETVQVEQRSKVKLIRNAKGDPQWEISVLARDGQNDEHVRDELDVLRGVAVDQYRKLESEFYGPPLGTREAVSS